MQSKILSRRNLAFVRYELLEVGILNGRPRYADHTRKTFDAALDSCERMATDFSGDVRRMVLSARESARKRIPGVLCTRAGKFSLLR